MLDMVPFDVLVHSHQSNDIKNLLKDILSVSTYICICVIYMKTINISKQNTRYLRIQVLDCKKMELTSYEEMLTQAEHRSS